MTSDRPVCGNWWQLEEFSNRRRVGSGGDTEHVSERELWWSHAGGCEIS